MVVGHISGGDAATVATLLRVLLLLNWCYCWPAGVVVYVVNVIVAGAVIVAAVAMLVLLLMQMLPLLSIMVTPLLLQGTSQPLVI